MYLHIGNDMMLRFEEIIGIFDIEALTKKEENKKIIENLQQTGNLEVVTKEEKTIILVEKEEGIKGYISNISSLTLAKRIHLEG